MIIGNLLTFAAEFVVLAFAAVAVFDLPLDCTACGRLVAPTPNHKSND
jgi:hypothetical protein